MAILRFVSIFFLTFIYSCSNEESKKLPYAPEWIESASWVDEVGLNTHDPLDSISMDYYRDLVSSDKKSITKGEIITVYNSYNNKEVLILEVEGIFYDKLRAACYLTDTEGMARNYLIVEGCIKGVKKATEKNKIKIRQFNNCNQSFDNTPCVAPFSKKICSDEIEYSHCLLMETKLCKEKPKNDCEVKGDKCSYVVDHGILKHFNNLAVKYKVQICNPKDNSCQAPEDCDNDLESLTKRRYFSPQFILPD